MRLAIVLIGLFLAACDGGDKPPPQYSPPPSSGDGWVVGPVINGVNYSPGVVWSNSGFDFPAAAPGVHGVTRAVTERGRSVSAIVMSFQIDGGGTLTEVDAGGGTPGQGKVRLFIQRNGDDWGGAGTGKQSYRFYSAPLDLIADGTVRQLNVQLTPDQWTNVNGQQDSAGFAALLADMGTVGMGFGGMFAMHGVYVSSGSARFTLHSYTVQ